MNFQQITIDLPEEILLTINETEEELKNEMKILLAVRLFKQNKITIGKASQIADLSRLEFENILSEYEIPISNLSIDDIKEDLIKLK
ncbi:MAG: UPF0175 family protein [Bacteroidales bacterium]|nr:UPF0175 family protein [Bacteroidales bacterium]